MNKILLIIAVIFAAVAVILFEWCNYQSKKIDALTASKTNLEANNNLLISKMKREYNDKIELSKKIEKLEELSKLDAGFDWNADISNTLIVGFLRENANKVH